MVEISEGLNMTGAILGAAGVEHAIWEGVKLMGVGMGVVFTFLILLVVVLNISGAYFTRNGLPAVEAEGGAPATAAPQPAVAADENAKVAVALAAAYRARGGR